MFGRKITTMIFGIMMSVFLFGTINVHAETKTFNKPNGQIINLIDAANQLNETYTHTEDTYTFSFNGKTISVKKNSPIITINDEQELIETERIGGIKLPKYTTLNINDTNVEFNYEKFLKITEYQHDKKGIEITVDDAYKAPEQSTVENLSVDYVKDHLIELGYTKQGDNTYTFDVNGTTYHEIRTMDNGVEIRLNVGDDYVTNQSINNLAVETMFKCFDNVDAETLYNAYLDGKDTSMTTDKAKITMTFTDTLNTVSITAK